MVVESCDTRFDALVAVPITGSGVTGLAAALLLPVRLGAAAGTLEGGAAWAMVCTGALAGGVLPTTPFALTGGGAGTLRLALATCAALVGSGVGTVGAGDALWLVVSGPDPVAGEGALCVAASALAAATGPPDCTGWGSVAALVSTRSDAEPRPEAACPAVSPIEFAAIAGALPSRASSVAARSARAMRNQLRE
jgi:hypothetical protein